MPNVRNMSDRMASHLARVSGKAMTKEMERIDRLFSARKISNVTRRELRFSAPIRLAYIANAS